MSELYAWFFYLLGAFCTLAWKLGRYIYVAKKKSIKTRNAILQWFFEDSSENAISWITTVGIVWVFGSCYIGKADLLFGDWLMKVPVVNSLAFLLGSLMEIAAPNAAKWVLSKLPGNSA